MNPGATGRVVRHAERVETRHRAHPASWWAQFPEVSGSFDAALVTEGITDLIIPKIASPLLRREAEIAADVVVRHLGKLSSPELAERSTGDDSGIAETYVVCHALRGDWDAAAAEAEPFVGTQPLLRVFVGALRLERFDTALAVRLLRAGQGPAAAVKAGLMIGKYGWWPDWLLKIVTERAMAGTLDQATITALDQCAYAELSPAQAKMAGRLLNGDQALIDASAFRLEGLGEPRAATKLREGDLNAVALAARLIPL